MEPAPSPHTDSEHCLSRLLASPAALFNMDAAMSREKAPEKDRPILSPPPRDTHVVGLLDQPLFIVQNVPDAAYQFHGTAVIRVLEESRSVFFNCSHAWLHPAHSPSSPSAFSQEASGAIVRCSSLSLTVPPLPSHLVCGELKTYHLQSTSIHPAPWLSQRGKPPPRRPAQHPEEHGCQTSEWGW